MNVLIGCPVAHRDWIIRPWADHLETAAAAAGFDPSFIVAAHPDDPTPQVLAAHTSTPVTVVPVDEPRDYDVRDWNDGRYARMATIRNELLAAVRDLQPDLYFSIDSDILVHPAALATMHGLIERGFDGSSTACFLKPAPRPRRDGTAHPGSYICPNYAMFVNGSRIHRPWTSSPCKTVDVIMAIKAMTPAAYQVDYRHHDQGEDVGWALECRHARLRLAWASRPASKHVMTSHCQAHIQHDTACNECVSAIARVDPRVGY